MSRRGVGSSICGALLASACAELEFGEDARWQEVESPTTRELRAISGVSSTDIWAVGTEGAALHFDGARWQAASSGTGELLQTVWAVSAADVWAGGIGGVRRWDGAAWRADPWFEASSFVSAIHGSGPDDVWVVETGRLSRWDGAAWDEVATPDDEWFEQLWRPDGEDLWAAGDEAAIYRLRGAAWERFAVEDLGGVYVWNSMSGCSPTDIWATGQVLGAGGGGGFAYHWDGVAWERARLLPDDPAVLPVPLEASWCGAADDVWVVGAFTAYHWNGSEWSTHDFEVPLLGVWGSDTDVWAVGSVGALLRTRR
jgi:hypothetical protein